jgi:hypothetical protein
MQTQRLNINDKKYYNLIRFIDKKTSQEKLTLILKTAKLKSFHVQCLKKYVVKNDVRKHQVIEHFFICNADQIRFARRFVSDFLIQTDATFNTNHLNMSLSVLMSITNTVKTFAVTYCFVSSESVEVFTFINCCIRDLTFHDDCSESAIRMRNFSTELSSTMTEKKKMKLKLDAVESEIQLQLCSWHVAKTMKKRLIVEDYFFETRSELINLIRD